MKYWITFILCFLFSAPLLAQDDKETASEDSLEKKVEDIIGSFIDESEPGCAISIIKEGEVLLSSGFGMSNLDFDIPNTAESIFRIASISKHITACCMLLLEEEKKVKLDADVREYLPELPDYGEKITIRHLLHHTSGLREYSYLMNLCDIGEDDGWKKEEALELIFRQQSLDFRPGERFSYCNTGYFLCSIICEKVSGKSLREYAHEKIFTPLEMKNSHFHDDSNEVVKKRSTGYSPLGKGRYEISETGLDMVGDGGLYTNVLDFGRWTHALLADEWKPGLLNKLLQDFTLIDGTELDYKLGLSESTWMSQRIVSHGGAWVGYRSNLLMFPDQKIAVICFSNRSNFNPSSVTQKLAQLVVKSLIPNAKSKEDDWPERSEKESSSPLDPNWDPTDFVGLYVSDELQVSWYLKSNPQLTLTGWGAKNYSIKQTGKDQLGGPRWLHLKVKRDSSGKVTALEFGDGVPSGILFKRYALN